MNIFPDDRERETSASDYKLPACKREMEEKGGNMRDMFLLFCLDQKRKKKDHPPVHAYIIGPPDA